MKKIIFALIIGFSVFYVFTEKQQSESVRTPTPTPTLKISPPQTVKHPQVQTETKNKEEDFSTIEKKTSGWTKADLQNRVHQLDSQIKNLNTLSYAEMSPEQLSRFNNLNRELSVVLKKLIYLKHGSL